MHDGIPFTTPAEHFDMRIKHSAGTHARVGYIGGEDHRDEPAVALFRFKKFIGILTIEDARRLRDEIEAVTRWHPTYE